MDKSSKARLVVLEGFKQMELWLCLDNFFVITRYNTSKMYAMAVYQLASLIQNEYQTKHHG
jgi:membrane-bound lytic murein transglycosylase B